MSVLSVTVFGTVTGQPLSQLQGSDIGPGELIIFPLTAVIGVVRGPNWDERVGEFWSVLKQRGLEEMYAAHVASHAVPDATASEAAATEPPVAEPAAEEAVSAEVVSAEAAVEEAAVVTAAHAVEAEAASAEAAAAQVARNITFGGGATAQVFGGMASSFNAGSASQPAGGSGKKKNKKKGKKKHR